MEQPASRHQCCLALKTFLDFAVHEHHQPQCWLVSDRDHNKLRGAQRKQRLKAYPTDEKCLALFDLLEKDNPNNPGWANVIRLMRVYGIRMWVPTTWWRKLIRGVSSACSSPQARRTRPKAPSVKTIPASCVMS